MYKVYVHRRSDNDEIFYVGYGKNSRPYQKSRGRNTDWHVINDTVGSYAEVIARYDDVILAQQHEMLYIAGCHNTNIKIVNKKIGGNDKLQGTPKTTAVKQKISAARLLNNGNAVKVTTPLGNFLSMAQAAKAHNMSIEQMYYRIRKHKPGFTKED